MPEIIIAKPVICNKEIQKYNSRTGKGGELNSMICFFLTGPFFDVIEKQLAMMCKDY